MAIDMATTIKHSRIIISVEKSATTQEFLHVYMCIRKLSNTVLQVFDDSLVCNSEDNFSSFFQLQIALFFHCNTFLNCCVCCSSIGEGRGQMTLVRVMRGT